MLNRVLVVFVVFVVVALRRVKGGIPGLKYGQAEGGWSEKWITTDRLLLITTRLLLIEIWAGGGRVVRKMGYISTIRIKGKLWY